MRIVAFIACLLSIGGIFLPWQAVSDNWLLAGIQSLTGMITGALALILANAQILAWWRKQNIPAWAYLLTSVLSLSCLFIFMAWQMGWLSAHPAPPLAAIFSLPHCYGWLISLTGTTLLLITALRINKKENAYSLAQGRTAVFIAGRVAFNRTAETGSRTRFSRFIIRLSIVATVISVLVMIVTLSLANGFQETVSRKVFSFLGHLRIQEKQPEKSIISEETIIEKDDSLVAAIRKNPMVDRIHPFATRYAMLKTREDMEGVMIKGVDSSFDFNRFAPFLISGRPLRFSDPVFNQEILLSDYTARQLQLKLNDRILLYFIRAGRNEDGSNGMPDIRPYKLTITGIYKTGIEEYDRTFALADLRLVQRQNIQGPDDTAYKNEIGGYEVFLKDYRDIDKAVEDIYAMDNFPLTWDTVSVRSISPNIFDWLNMQDVTRNVLIAFMIIVAVINLITCLIILVLERIRMIGILKALGATDWTIQRIFLRHTLLIALSGVFIGTVLALGLLHLQQATGFISLPEDAYYVNKAAVKIVWWQVAAIGAGTLLICLMVLMIPSLIARKVRPVNAIRFR